MSQSYQLFKKTNEKLLMEGDTYGKRIMHEITCLINDPSYQASIVKVMPGDTYAYQILGIDDFEALKRDAMINALRLEGFVFSTVEGDTENMDVVTVNGQAMKRTIIQKIRLTLRKPRNRNKVYLALALISVLQLFIPYAELSQRVRTLNIIWIIFVGFAIDYSFREAKQLELVFPSLIGMQVEDARQMIADQGFKVGNSILGRQINGMGIDGERVVSAKRGLFGRSIELNSKGGAS
ncbi:hypothetical protein EQG49_12110 [Periweissella cryptocerci]|uniref:Uncharacterized protein n=1 Tax=Periweissella cryptocerci TaxID=2506420 RepID=A0A4P6YWC7_9LACO|nr:PASTA domain-containing protein [Periweissella cryptocerci]QBO37144.1 hypothetical protein EQG49_12110 [Periweissella cryptocerci]